MARATGAEGWVLVGSMRGRLGRVLGWRAWVLQTRQATGIGQRLRSEGRGPKELQLRRNRRRATRAAALAMQSVRAGSRRRSRWVTGSGADGRAGEQSYHARYVGCHAYPYPINAKMTERLHALSKDIGRLDRALHQRGANPGPEQVAHLEPNLAPRAINNVVHVHVRCHPRLLCRPWWRRLRCTASCCPPWTPC